MRPGARQAPCDFPLASYYATTVETSAWAQPNTVLAANCRKHWLSRPLKSTLPRRTSPCTAKVLETCLCPPLCRRRHGGGRVLWSPRRSCCLGEGLRRGGRMAKLISNRQEYPEKMKFHDSLRFTMIIWDWKSTIGIMCWIPEHFLANSSKIWCTNLCKRLQVHVTQFSFQTCNFYCFGDVAASLSCGRHWSNSTILRWASRRQRAKAGGILENLFAFFFPIWCVKFRNTKHL